MVINGETGKLSGPLLDILDEAAKSIGYSVTWQSVPFPRSMENLRTGESDIVPRLVMTEERKAIAEFLGPIGVQPMDIEFLVKPGQEHTLKSYEDLVKMTVGVKWGTSYFDKFDKDASLQKVGCQDDENLALMFTKNLITAMIVLDRPAIEKIMKANSIGYVWADYKEPIRLGIFYGMSKSSKHIAISGPLSAALKKMVISGRVAEIYYRHKATPPPSK
jgi:polar amino acid transport system substrate-binding protein